MVGARPVAPAPIEPAAESYSVGSPPLHILVNALVLSSRSGIAGVSRVVIETLRALSQLETQHRVSILCTPCGAELIPEEVSFERVLAPAITSRTFARVAWEHTGLPVLLAKLKPDVLHSTTWAAPSRLPCASVVTVPDMTWFSHRSMHSPMKGWYFRTLTPTSIRGSQVTIAISESTRSEVLKRVAVPSERIVTVMQGVNTGMFAPQALVNVEKARQKYGLEGPYLFFVGYVHPRKNLAVVIRALRELALSGLDLIFAVAGKLISGQGELSRAISELGLERRVKFLGVVPNEDLPALYSGATASVYPSLFEGFGLPVLEAMACGCPCIASDQSSIPEVAGDAALLFDPSDHVALARSVCRLIEDKALRDQLIAKGLKQAAQLSWVETARRTLAIYERAAYEWRAQVGAH